MVYDATWSGLNHCLWAPNFGMPAVDMLVHGISKNSWMVDLDISKMFLNFCVHPDLCPYYGVDLKPVFLEEASEGLTLGGRWV
jgi:hypothetical protein